MVGFPFGFPAKQQEKGMSQLRALELGWEFSWLHREDWISGTSIGVRFGCFGRQIGGPGLIIYQGYPSISPKRTPMGIRV